MRDDVVFFLLAVSCWLSRPVSSLRGASSFYHSSFKKSREVSKKESSIKVARIPSSTVAAWSRTAAASRSASRSNSCRTRWIGGEEEEDDAVVVVVVTGGGCLVVSNTL